MTDTKRKVFASFTVNILISEEDDQKLAATDEQIYALCDQLDELFIADRMKSAIGNLLEERLPVFTVEVKD